VGVQGKISDEKGRETAAIFSRYPNCDVSGVSGLMGYAEFQMEVMYYIIFYS
jgi:hypothetical protein